MKIAGFLNFRARWKEIRVEGAKEESWVVILIIVVKRISSDIDAVDDDEVSKS